MNTQKRLLERKLDRTTTKKSYKNVVWFYNIWSLLTESKAADHVIKTAGIRDGEAILEIACGTGIVFEEVVKRNPIGKNIGIDLSPDMLEKAKRRLQKIENANYELEEGDVLRLDFETNSFDLVINNFMIDLMPADTFDKIAETFFRILKPQGRVVVSTFSYGNKKVNKIWHWVAKRFPDLLAGCRPVSFGENLTKAGFEITSVTEISQNTFPSEVINARKGKMAGATGESPDSSA